jgi:hypothetical protein
MTGTPDAVKRAIKAAGRAEYRRVRDFLDETKAGQVCADCGRDDLGLHFHHLDPSTKLYPVSNATTVAAARREMAKCILLCPFCHRDRHRRKHLPNISRTERFEGHLSAPDSTE